MRPLPPLPTNATTAAEIRDWDHAMQDWINDAVDAVASILAAHATEEALAHALGAELADIDPEGAERLVARVEAGGRVVVENIETEDGVVLVRQAEGWWPESADSRQGVERPDHQVASRVLSYIWWADLEMILAMSARWRFDLAGGEPEAGG